MFPSIISFGSFSEVSDSSGRVKESLKTGLFLKFDFDEKIFAKSYLKPPDNLLGFLEL